MTQVCSKKTEYSISVPSGAPVPVVPTSPENLGLQIPTEPVSSAQMPPAVETGRDLIPADKIPTQEPTGGAQLVQYDYPAQPMMIVPPGVGASNKLYVSFIPQTVAGCTLYGWQSIWLQTYNLGPIWFYEWYPSGWLDVRYLGYSSRGWHKKWFQGDTPGWHILQYFSGGWSNYVYIYVYSWSPGWQNSPTPSPTLWPGLGPHWFSSESGIKDSITSGIETTTSSDGFVSWKSSPFAKPFRTGILSSERQMQRFPKN